MSARRLHYGWVIVAVVLLALVMSAGFRSTTGLLIDPLQEEFGWSKGEISLAVSINLVLFGLVGPFAAALMERFGVRGVMLAALTVVAGASALTTVIDAPWQLDLLWGVAMGCATGAISVPLAAIVATRWFARRRGLVTGVLTASTATGQLVFLPLLALLVAAWGWRSAAWTVSLVALAVVVPVVWAFMRDRPEQVGLRAYGAVADEPPSPVARNPFAAAAAGLALAARSRVFWLLGGSFFVCGATTTGLIATHLIPAAHDHGLGEVAAASLLAAVGVFDIVGTIASGHLTDRYDSRLLLCVYYALRGLSLIALPAAFGSPHAGLIAFAVVYGLDWVATVPPTVALTIRHFGPERAGVVFGWVFACHQLGAAVAAGVAGVLRDAAGSYSSAFVAFGVLALVASLLVLRIDRPAAALAALPASEGGP